jgi:hypothetical protein
MASLPGEAFCEAALQMLTQSCLCCPAMLCMPLALTSYPRWQTRLAPVSVVTWVTGQGAAQQGTLPLWLLACCWQPAPAGFECMGHVGSFQFLS